MLILGHSTDLNIRCLFITDLVYCDLFLVTKYDFQGIFVSFDRGQKGWDIAKVLSNSNYLILRIRIRIYNNASLRISIQNDH